MAVYYCVSHRHELLRDAERHCFCLWLSGVEYGLYQQSFVQDPGRGGQSLFPASMLDKKPLDTNTLDNLVDLKPGQQIAADSDGTTDRSV